MQRRFTPLDVLGRGAAVVSDEPAPPPRVPRDGAPLIVSCALYHRGRRRLDVTDIEESLELAGRTEGFVWIGLWEPTEEEFEDIARQFRLPPLAVEDAIRAHQRPKLESYGDMLFAVIKPTRYIDAEEDVEVGEMAVFLGEHFVITVRHGESRIPGAARARLEDRPDKLIHGPAAVLHEIMDMVVDDYLAVLDAIETDIDEIEAQVFSGTAENNSERIYKLKREVLDFRRAVAPLVAPLQMLVDDDSLGLSEAQRHNFRDVHDHCVRAAESIEAFDSLLTGVLQADLAQVSVRQNEVAARQNEDMRKISAWAAIGLVPTAIAGIYGMNFEHMPELKWQFGYFMVLGIIVACCSGLYAAFRRNGWL